MELGTDKLPRYSCACHKNNIAVRWAINADKYLPRVLKNLSSYSAKHKNSINRNKLSIQKNEKFKFKKCVNENCKICKFALDFHYLESKNLVIPFRSFSNCESKGVVYIILCTKCNEFYIGESGRSVKERISEHINNIKRFQKNIRKALIDLDKMSEVAVHFSLSGHHLDKHFKFCIFENNLINNNIRLSIETDVINLFLNSNNEILNKKKPGLFNIEYFTFQNEF